MTNFQLLSHFANKVDYDVEHIAILFGLTTKELEDVWTYTHVPMWALEKAAKLLNSTPMLIFDDTLIIPVSNDKEKALIKLLYDNRSVAEKIREQLAKSYTSTPFIESEDDKQIEQPKLSDDPEWFNIILDYLCDKYDMYCNDLRVQKLVKSIFKSIPHRELFINSEYTDLERSILLIYTDYYLAKIYNLDPIEHHEYLSNLEKKKGLADACIDVYVHSYEQAKLLDEKKQIEEQIKQLDAQLSRLK